MINFIPIWQLPVIIYPHETYRLHVSNEAIKYLVTDCYGENKPFGLIPLINNRRMDSGTTLLVKEVVDVTIEGKMDIIVEGQEIFQSLEFIQMIPNKPYGGAIATYPTNVEVPNVIMTPKLLNQISLLHKILHFDPKFEKPYDALTSYDLAKVVGMTLEEQSLLLTYLQENQRLEFIRRHIERSWPILEAIANMRNEINHRDTFKKF